MPRWTAYLFVAVTLAQCLALEDGPRAHTENGPVLGVYESSLSGFKYQSFKGVPYAEPPVGSNRFKEPQRLEKNWIGEWDATKVGGPCLQLNQFLFNSKEDGHREFAVVGDEDCLFLNIFTQVGGPAKKKVIMGIHGGAFMYGTGNNYGPKFIMDDPNIVYVALNYRLGPLGFLSTGDGVIPGNFGLKDQVAALQWIQRNIANFGGDPSKVTVAGLSAGGTSVDYMYMTPLTNGLFNKGISLSGSALCSWSLMNDGPFRARQLASAVGCQATDSVSILKCLRRRPARQIVGAVQSILTWLYNPFTLFGPVVEVNSTNPYIDQHPREILKKGLGKDLPWLAGLTTEEGLFPGGDFIFDDKLMGQVNSDWHRIAPAILFVDSQLPQEERSKIVDELKDHYIGTGDITAAKKHAFVKLMGDRIFSAGIVETAALRSKTNTVFLYEYGYEHKRGLLQKLSGKEDLLGSSHCDDAANVFDMGFISTRNSAEEKQIAASFRDIFLTFAKTGNVPEKYNWEPIAKDSSGGFNHLKIRNAAITTTTESMGDFAFLNTVFKNDASIKEEL